jgi:hypothetical protein
MRNGCATAGHFPEQRRTPGFQNQSAPDASLPRRQWFIGSRAEFLNFFRSAEGLPGYRRRRVTAPKTPQRQSRLFQSGQHLRSPLAARLKKRVVVAFEGYQRQNHCAPVVFTAGVPAGGGFLAAGGFNLTVEKRLQSPANALAIGHQCPVAGTDGFALRFNEATPFLARTPPIIGSIHGLATRKFAVGNAKSEV